MTQTHSLREPAHLDVPRRRRAWPLTAAAAGLSGAAALTPQVLEDLDPVAHRASTALGYLTVVLLLVTAAHWRRRVETRVPGSTAVRLVPLGLVASAAALTYGYGWKGPLGDHVASGWLGVVVAAGAVTWMALRERTVSRWLGVASVVPVVQAALVVAGTDVPAVTALLAPVWLVVAGLGLALGRSTIVR